MRQRIGVNSKPSILKQFAWAGLSGCLIVAGFLIALPYIPSENSGVIWPSGVKMLIAAGLLLIGLSTSRRAGRLQYASYLLLAACFAAYVLGLRMVLNVAGVSGVG